MTIYTSGFPQFYRHSSQRNLRSLEHKEAELVNMFVKPNCILEGFNAIGLDPVTCSLPAVPK